MTHTTTHPFDREILFTPRRSDFVYDVFVGTEWVASARYQGAGDFVADEVCYAHVLAHPVIDPDTLVIRAEAPAQLAARVEEPSVLFCEIEGCDNDPVMLDPFPICAGHLSDPDYGAAHAPSRCVGFIPGQCGNVAQPGEPFCPECAAGLDRVVVAAYIQRLADDAGRCVFCAGDHLSADCRLRKPLVVPAPTTCGNCGAAHSIQRCPAVWQALRAA